MKFQSEINGQCRKEGTLIRDGMCTGGARREDGTREVGCLLAAFPLSSGLSAWVRSVRTPFCCLAEKLSLSAESSSGHHLPSILTCADTLQFLKCFYIESPWIHPTIPSCAGGIICPIFQIRKLRLGEATEPGLSSGLLLLIQSMLFPKPSC